MVYKFVDHYCNISHQDCIIKYRVDEKTWPLLTKIDTL